MMICSWHTPQTPSALEDVLVVHIQDLLLVVVNLLSDLQCAVHDTDHLDATCLMVSAGCRYNSGCSVCTTWTETKEIRL